MGNEIVLVLCIIGMITSIFTMIRNRWTYKLRMAFIHIIHDVNGKLINKISIDGDGYSFADYDRDMLVLEDEFESYGYIMMHFWQWNAMEFWKKTGKLYKVKVTE